MRKISANYIFPVSGAPLKNGIIVLDSNNVIVDLIDTKGHLKEMRQMTSQGVFQCMRVKRFALRIRQGIT